MREFGDTPHEVHHPDSGFSGPSREVIEKYNPASPPPESVADPSEGPATDLIRQVGSDVRLVDMTRAEGLPLAIEASIDEQDASHSEQRDATDAEGEMIAPETAAGGAGELPPRRPGDGTAAEKEPEGEDGADRHEALDAQPEDMKAERLSRLERMKFNVERLSDEEIISLHRALYEVSGSDRKADSLWDDLTTDVRALASQSPDRVKNLVRRCSYPTGYSIDVDQSFAAYVTPGLAQEDYTFTRDMLISLIAGNAHQRNLGGCACELAENQLRLLMRDQLTPEQVADFNARLAPIYDPELLPLEPADQDEQL